MADLIDEIANLKDLARLQRNQGKHDAAVQTLQQGIQRLEAALGRSKGTVNKGNGGSEPADEQERRIAAELADLYGILGGTLREQGDLHHAAAAYDEGFQYESNPRYGLAASSYNALNRLVTRIHLCPLSLSEPDSLRKEEKLEFVNVRQNLIDLQRQLQRHVAGVRSHDFWAAGDLAFICTLNGDDKGATEAWERFASLSPSPHAYSAYSNTIGALAQHDTPRKNALANAEAWLKKKMNEASDVG